MDDRSRPRLAGKARLRRDRVTGKLLLLYPERGTQMSFMVQAIVLLVSGVYYSVDVLPLVRTN